MVKSLLLDLDNTVYPSSSKINEGIDQRMIQFVSDFLHVDFESARKLRSERKKKFGTTLEWLQKEHGLTDVNAYLWAVHPESEVSELAPIPGLKEFFESIPLPMAILTNGPDFHAKRVLDFYQISHCFIGVHDIIENKLKGKPNPSAYLKALNDSNFKLEETLFIDDYPKYVYGYISMGGTGVLIDPVDKYADYKFSTKGKLCTIKTIYELPSLFTNSI